MSRGKLNEKTLFTIKTSQPKNGNKTVFRVVRWSDRAKPVLEKREQFKGDDGRWKNGKVKGLTYDDIVLLEENWDDVLSALEGEEVENEAEISDDDDNDDYEE